MEKVPRRYEGFFVSAITGALPDYGGSLSEGSCMKHGESANSAASQKNCHDEVESYDEGSLREWWGGVLGDWKDF